MGFCLGCVILGIVDELISLVDDAHFCETRAADRRFPPISLLMDSHMACGLAYAICLDLDLHVGRRVHLFPNKVLACFT